MNGIIEGTIDKHSKWYDYNIATVDPSKPLKVEWIYAAINKSDRKTIEANFMIEVLESVLIALLGTFTAGYKRIQSNQLAVMHSVRPRDLPSFDWIGCNACSPLCMPANQRRGDRRTWKSVRAYKVVRYCRWCRKLVPGYNWGEHKRSSAHLNNNPSDVLGQYERRCIGCDLRGPSNHWSHHLKSIKHMARHPDETTAEEQAALRMTCPVCGDVHSVQWHRKHCLTGLHHNRVLRGEAVGPQPFDQDGNAMQWCGRCGVNVRNLPSHEKGSQHQARLRLHANRPFCDTCQKSVNPAYHGWAYHLMSNDHRTANGLPVVKECLFQCPDCSNTPPMQGGSIKNHIKSNDHKKAVDAHLQAGTLQLWTCGSRQLVLRELNVILLEGRIR